MSAERIDHVAEANDTLQEVGYPASNEGVMLHALTHATLALVEQQRIANLIAIAGMPSIDDDIRISPLEQEAWEALGFRGTGEMRPEVREALGLS